MQLRSDESMRNNCFCLVQLRSDESMRNSDYAQISHLSNFSDLKLWFILIYEHSKPEQIDIQLQYISYFTNIAVQNVNKEFVYITDFTASLTGLNVHCATRYRWRVMA